MYNKDLWHTSRDLTAKYTDQSKIGLVLVLVRRLVFAEMKLPTEVNLGVHSKFLTLKLDTSIFCNKKTDFLSHVRLISTKHHIKYSCLGNKERPMFHIFILKSFLFISKKSHKASRGNLLLFGVICQKPQKRGGGKEYILP